MKILHIQDGWEIPQFVKELSEVPAIADACVIIDATDLFKDDSLHFIVSEEPLTDDEIKLAVKEYFST